MAPKTLYFVHIPKTAGRYLVVRALNHELIAYKHLPRGKIYQGHETGRLYYGGHNVCHSSPSSPIRYFGHDCSSDAEFQSSLSFAIVRNPFDLLVSMFKARWPFQPELDPRSFSDFGDFVRAYCDPGFDWPAPLQQRHLFFQILNDSGRCAVDRLLRFEELDAELAQMCGPLNIQPAVSEPFRPSRRGEDREHRHWYTDHTRELVQAKCALELEQLGYDFDGVCAPMDLGRVAVPVERAAA